ncbi:MAG: NAD(P)H-binding protein [Candidatus Marinimicrobia bacterium]|nr:NAD(P)H-binding protein [Candidatus Neomarinimicrobiota bacterium]MCF7850280.1 NAD(P)H-binding protein [Candidatus Neomarinimicrobiota bacterium]MCF7903823.1 NAD(P)H-binding protein [Candidatus Neomarinimicrobiota bacterium]
MNILIVGATGATGKRLVEQLLERGQSVKAFVREGSELPEGVRGHKDLTIINGSVLDLPDMELVTHVKDCDAVVSCLGHNISFKGLFLPPRKLVRDSIRKLYQAVQLHEYPMPVKFLLMNTTGNRNRDLNEKISLKHRIVVALLRILLPPQADNEAAANFLRVHVGQTDDKVEWLAVRPDGLIDEEAVTGYDVHPSPVRDPIFDAGQTSRINVAHFMAELILNTELWNKWKGQMPVIYNRDHGE